MPEAALFFARFCSSAWIGAAALFVVVGVREVSLGSFDATTTDTLVALRFPAFYLAGAILVASSCLGTFFAAGHPALPRCRRMIALATLMAVLVVIAADYLWIYQPLFAMVTPPGQVKPPSFTQFHEASKYVNLLGLTLCLVASVSLNWPQSKA